MLYKRKCIVDIGSTYMVYNNASVLNLINCYL